MTTCTTSLVQTSNVACAKCSSIRLAQNGQHQSCLNDSLVFLETTLVSCTLKVDTILDHHSCDANDLNHFVEMHLEAFATHEQKWSFLKR